MLGHRSHVQSLQRLCLVGFTDSGHQYGSLTQLTEAPGRCKNVVPVPRVMWHGRLELAEVSGTGVNSYITQETFRVRAWKSCRTHRSPRYGCGSLTELRGPE